MNTANGPAESLGFVMLYVRLDLQDLEGGIKVGRMKCHVVDKIDHILIGLKDLERFKLYDVLRKIGERAVAADSEIDRDTGFNCYPVSMDEMLPTKEVADAHPDGDVEAILQRHGVIFGDTLSPSAANAFEPMNLRLADPLSPKPRSLQAKTRPQPLAWSTEIATQLQGLLDQGVIETTSSTFWSQVLMVKKLDGKLRLCVDYRALNKLLVHEGWQLPNISELLRKLAGKRFFGKVDMTAGYHQLPIGLGQELTAFRINGNTYKFTKVPFGLQSAPSYFAYQMQTRILNGLENICLVYLDDVIIFGETREEYLKNMEIVLNRFEERGILIKRSKCVFCVEEIGFLGHVVSGGGIKLSDDRKASLKNLSLPSTITQLRSFLGAANYFRQFIDGYALIAKDLHQLAAKSPTKHLLWTEDLKRSFERVKSAVVAAPSLKFLSQDPKDEIILYTDASDYAFGGYLVQRQMGIEEPILFYSKAFNPVQSRWSVSDKEMYSIVHGVLANHHLLMGRRFTIRSDHKALIYNDHISASSKIERWKVSLSEYDIVWSYIKGEENVIADCLSRVVDNSHQDESEELLEPLTMLILSEDTTKNTASEDETTLSISEYQHNMIKKHHGPCHFGKHDTLKSLKNHNYDWRFMAAQVQKFTESCELCQMIKTRTHPEHTGTYSIKSDRPGERISLDVMEYDEDIFNLSFILVIVDCFHSYTTLIPLKSIKAGEIYHALIHYFCDDGIPDVVYHDLGASLNAIDVKLLMEFFKINTIITAPRDSQGNGIAEQKISKVRQVMKLLIEEHSTSLNPDAEVAWSLILPFTQRALNVMTGSTGYSPAEIRFGIANRLDGLKELSVPPGLAQQQKEVIDIAKANLDKHKKKKEISELSVFKSNELVIIKNPIHLKRNVRHSPYLGPFKVTSQNNTAVTLTLASNPTIIKTVKNSEVFRYKEHTVPRDQIATVPGLSLVPFAHGNTINK